MASFKESLFGQNALTTPVGQLIDQATDGSQSIENWALYMEVCDLINETDEGPKDSVKAFRKKISQNVGKSYTSVMYCLTCIESCVKNCGRRFHIQVVNKDFLHDLIKIIGPKNDPPLTVQEKVLSMIQTWADAFRGNPELKEIEKVYQELKQKGVEFPMTDMDNLAPIHTPARSVPEREQAPVESRGGTSRGPPVAVPPAAFAPTEGYPPYPAPPPAAPQGGGGAPEGLTQAQSTKLRRELEVVQGNTRVMSEMLTELSPGAVDASDLELLQELNRTCRQMQSRIVELLNEIATEDVTNELLSINDDLNNVFIRYERFERYRSGQTGQTAPASSAEPAKPTEALPPPSYDQVGAATPAATTGVGNLIDLSESAPPPTTQMAGLALTPQPPTSAVPPLPPKGDDDFDMFAQSRQSFDQNKQMLGSFFSLLSPHWYSDTWSYDILKPSCDVMTPDSGSYSTQQGDTLNIGLGQAASQRTQQDQKILNMTDEETMKLQEKDSDYDEMEQWLATHGGPRPDGEPQSISSSEFDRFLTERATTSDTVPSIPAQTGQQPARTTRTLKKDDDENPLFAL